MTAPATGKPTLDQRRARHAWEVVEQIKPPAGDVAERYRRARDFRRQAKQLPARIMTAGVGHALAFVKEKGKTPDLLTAVGDWVLDKRDNPNSTAPRPDDDALLKLIIKKDAAFLRRATEETLAYLLWLNRFAAIELPEADDDE